MVSITQEKESDTVAVFVRLFYDDFLLDYTLDITNNEIVTPDNNGLFSKEKMNNYINNRLNVLVNNKLLKSELISQDYRKADNEISLNLYCISEEVPVTVEVMNKLIINVHADQENMTIIKFSDFEQGVKFSSLLTSRIFRLTKTTP